jgi:uncharacterized protein (TIGR00251 family)
MSRTIAVKVIARASKNAVKVEGERLKVYVTAPALDGKANAAVRELLAEHFKTNVSRVTIVRGLTSPLKTVSIDIP